MINLKVLKFLDISLSRMKLLLKKASFLLTDCIFIFSFIMTRKYSLRGYILGVLTYTTTWDQLWGGDDTLK